MFHGKAYLLEDEPMNFYVHRYIEADNIETAIELGRESLLKEISHRDDLSEKSENSSLEVEEFSQLDEEKLESPGFIFYAPDGEPQS